MKKFVCIVGPTASGKSSVAMEIAKRHNGEIICADSQTIRKGLDIGTAKPSKQDQAEIRHHMLDIIGPYDTYSAAEFKRRADVLIEQIKARDRLPILVGGTGLYVDAVLFKYSFNQKADKSLREILNNKSVEELQAVIQEKGLEMPENKKNPRHLIRTIESAGQAATRKDQRQDVVMVGIDPGREALKERIASRVRQMLDDGFIGEVQHVVAKYGSPPVHWDAIGYKITLQHMTHDRDQKVNDAKVEAALIVAHRQYAKRQRAWFKRNQSIIWFEQPADAVEYIEKHL